MNSTSITNGLLAAIVLLLAFIAWVLFTTRPVTMGELKAKAGTASAFEALSRQPTVFVNDGHVSIDGGEVDVRIKPGK